MNYVHLMKRVAIATLCVLSTANAQDKRFAFKGSAASSGSGITVVTAREKTGWTSNGTTAQDTLATVYRLDKANIRFIVTDADGDTLWFYPQNLHPFVLKDGTSLLSGIDSTGRGYFGGNATTTGQTGRAFLNVVGIGDTLAAFIGDGNRAPGDSSVLIHADAALQSASRAGFGVSTSGQATRAFMNVLGRAANDTLAIWSNDGGGVVGDSTVMIRASGNIQSGARAGFGVATSGQAGRAILNVARDASFDTLALFIGDANRTVGDSSIIFLPNGLARFGGSIPIGINDGSITTLGANSLTRDGNVLIIASGLSFSSANGQFAVGTYFNANMTGRWQGLLTVRNTSPTSDTLLVVRNDKNSTLDSTAMVFADGSHQFGVTAGGTNAFSGTAEHDTVAVTGASVNDIYTVTIKGAAAPAAADLFAVEALATGFAVHRSAAGTSGLEYYWRRERR